MSSEEERQKKLEERLIGIEAALVILADSVEERGDYGILQAVLKSIMLGPAKTDADANTSVL